jgi:DNA polymerase-3 subunit delta'
MLLGHESKEDDFRNAATGGTLRHAYLFFGDTHIGKCTFAVSFANFLENGTFDVPTESLLDTRVFSKNEKGTISIDEMRELKKFLSQHPFKSPRKTAIIDDAETLTEEAQSSLLKVVEEPPVSSLIIFIAPSENILFRPLASRLSKVYFSRVAADTIERHLRMLYTIDVRMAKEIAAQAFGRVGIAMAHILGHAAGTHSEESLADEIDAHIQTRYREDARGTSGVLEELIRKESECRRFNLNPSLQKKAVAAILQKKHGRNF